MDFLFHKVSDKEKQEIKEQAKSIMDDFSKKLSKVDKEIEEPLIEDIPVQEPVARKIVPPLMEQLSNKIEVAEKESSVCTV